MEYNLNFADLNEHEVLYINGGVDWTSLAIIGIGLGIIAVSRYFKIKYGTAIGLTVTIIGIIASLD